MIFAGAISRITWEAQIMEQYAFDADIKSFKRKIFSYFSTNALCVDSQYSLLKSYTSNENKKCYNDLFALKSLMLSEDNQ